MRPPDADPAITLARLRDTGQRERFHALSEQLARLDRRRLIALCLPRAHPAAAAALVRCDERDLRIRPCFGRPGATLTARTVEGMERLASLGTAIGGGVTRLVAVPGLGGEALLPVLERLPLEELTSLRLDGQGLTSRRAVVEPGRDNLLFLRDLGDDPVTRAIASLPRLEDLRLCDNRIGPAGAACIAQLPRLRRLDLRGNAVGDAGAIRLSACQTLEVLRLQDNCIGPEGALALAEAKQLHVLDLRRNPVGSGADAVRRMAPRCEVHLDEDPTPLPRTRVLQFPVPT